MITHAVTLITKVPYGNLAPNRPLIVDPIQYRAIEPSAPPTAMKRYFGKLCLPGGDFTMLAAIGARI